MYHNKATQINLKGVTSTHGAAQALIHNPGDISLIERGRLRALVGMCPCGCGTVITINLDQRAGKAWVLYNRRNGISLYPSIWRDSGCESHFVIWKNRVLWLDGDWLFDEDNINQLITIITPLIPSHEFVHFHEIAERIDEVPWSVLRACRKLVSTGQFTEGRDQYHGYFKKVL